MQWQIIRARLHRFPLFAQVFHGEWRGREVAIKVMTQAGASRAVVDEFRREVSTMSALPDHPNVLRLLGACVQAPLALVTPYCQKCAASYVLGLGF